MSLRQNRNYLYNLPVSGTAQTVDWFTPTKLLGGEIYQLRAIVKRTDSALNFDMNLVQDAVTYQLKEVSLPNTPDAYKTYDLLPNISNLRTITLEQNTTLQLVFKRPLITNESVVFFAHVYEPGDN
jgi:hypothetical protein